MSAHPATTRPATTSAAYYGIGEVIAQLSDEFPDIRISKIRFLESEGLIEPARSPSGYRRFSRRDVQRLRYILTAQRDHYLPLRVIKEKLDSPEPGLAPDGEPPPPAGGRMLSRAELLAAAGIDSAQLDELEEYGLVRRRGRQYGQDALAVASLVAELARFGVQARHLRMVKAAAQRETSLIEQVVAPALRQRNAGAAERAAQMARDIAALSIRLHAALVESELGEAGLG
ncbi:MAG TPA: MerR family transcriptional regulator [Streptosporangiaceae bacterium]|nr:MerR family transcriptional regulator [Streptosporangiaceae bacterium]